MKKLIIYTLAIFILSCSKDNSAKIPSFTFEDILGDWRLTRRYRTLDPNGGGEKEDRLKFNEPCDHDGYRRYAYVDGVPKSLFVYYKPECFPDLDNYVEGVSITDNYVEIKGNYIKTIEPDGSVHFSRYVHSISQNRFVVRYEYTRNALTPTAYKIYEFDIMDRVSN